MTDFVLNRNYVHSSKLGHVIAFEKNVPVYVPPECHKEVAMIGAVPDDGSEVNILGDEITPVEELPTDERNALLVAAFKTLEERNGRGDFTGQGVPSVAALKKIVPFEVDRKEVESLWTAYRAEKGAVQ